MMVKMATSTSWPTCEASLRRARKSPRSVPLLSHWSEQCPALTAEPMRIARGWSYIDLAGPEPHALCPECRVVLASLQHLGRGGEWKENQE